MIEGRFPLDDLVALLRFSTAEIDRVTLVRPARSHRPSDDEARRILRVSAKSWRRYHVDGLTMDQAERLAQRAGRHPAEVWTDWYASMADHLVECAGCGSLFLPNAARASHAFCHRDCRRATSRRRTAQVVA